MEPLASNHLRFHFSFAHYPGRFRNPPRKISWRQSSTKSPYTSAACETRLKVIFGTKGNEMEPLASNHLRFHFSFADYPERFRNPPRKVIEWLKTLAGGNLPQNRHDSVAGETRLKVIFGTKGNEMELLASNHLKFHVSFVDYPGRFRNPPRKVIEWLKRYWEVKSETLHSFCFFLSEPPLQ
ncbi:hypothetical protein CDAR_584941 [Caerostris darwini]|uniref:Uncharacterized protein n=1 Tax=Caerostris darwini TaxID=1538125 RepID=A0AAV4UDL9_9ARAC|nr:hypothetical protein CDAR_584941 [Caerostris darwini]